MSTPTTLKEAKELVESIADDHGWIPEEIWAEMSERVQQAVRRSMKKKDNLIASSVMTLAKNLYTSEARFVFELLQNADDNAYTKAQAAGQDPCISFRISPNKVVVECNEDGFNRDNLVAICNVGRSSKKGAQGYIGEKGIGFKSVFMAAFKVEIRSGHFSFYFRHRPDDSGMGMISPMWQDPAADDEVPAGVTRMVLHLHDDDAGKLQAQRASIQRQFSELQDQILLFFKNLKRVQVAFVDENGRETETTSYSHAKTIGAPHRENVNINVTGKNARKEVKHYHVTRHVATNLAKNDNRTYSEEEKATKAYSTAMILLAFPLSEASEPVIQDQDVYAFLPVRKEGFKFMIHSDFVTQANREDLVVSSSRNTGLVRGIAEAFVRAVQQFCNDEKLQYTWMRYLPQEKEHPWNQLWACLIPQLKFRLRTTPVLRAWGPSATALRLIEHSRRFSPDFLDEHQEPLLEDLDPGAYISAHFKSKDLDLLKSYGLKAIQFEDVIDRLRADLRRPESRMKSNTTSTEWHSRMATLLSSPFVQPSGEMVKWAREYRHPHMELLPLGPTSSQDDSGPPNWTSLSSLEEKRVYFPNVDGVQIPLDLPNMVLLDAYAASIPERAAFFGHLGVKSATVKEIRELILDTHRAPGALILDSMVRHLEFLYLTHEMGDSYPDLTIPTADNKRQKVSETQDIYFQDDEPYGAFDLLSLKGGDEGADGLYLVTFLKPMVLEHSPAKVPSHGLSWRSWLETAVGIRSRLRLTTNSGLFKMIHPAWSFVAEKKPGMVIEALRLCWPAERAGILASKRASNLLQSIRETKVQMIGGQTVMLKDSWLPLPRLLGIYARYIGSDGFPFVKLDRPLDEDTVPEEWKFLWKDLQVGKGDNVNFYIEILGDDCFITKGFSGVLEIYQKMYGLLIQEHGDSSFVKDSVREAFNKWNLLFRPTNEEGNYTTEGPIEKYLWSGPASMKTKCPLQPLIGPETPYHNRAATEFIRNVLNVPDCSWKDIIDELEKGEIDSLDTAIELYQWLIDMKLVGNDKKGLKEAFETKPLIYVPGDPWKAWFTVSECLWSSPTPMSGKATLESHYSSMKSFFVSTLGVSTLNAQMIYDELSSMGDSKRTTVEQATEKIKVLNSFLVDADENLDPKLLLNKRIFPVRYPFGDVKLVPAEVDFSIIDRQPLADAFRYQVRTLNFDLVETQKLKPFLSWLGLEDRYLSNAVNKDCRLEGDGAVLLTDPRKSLAPKAHALFRIANHCGTDRGVALYNTLKNSSLYESDKISTKLSLTQDGKTFTYDVPCGKSGIFIEEDTENHNVKIYIPRNPSKQAIAFRTTLPHHLLEWMIHRGPAEETAAAPAKLDPLALGALMSILTLDRLNGNDMSELLDEQGIANVSFADDFDYSVIPEMVESDDISGPRIGTPSLSSPSTTRDVWLDSGGEDNSYSYRTPSSSAPPTSSPSGRHRAYRFGSYSPSKPRAPRGFADDVPLIEEREGDERYLKLLNQVIANGSRMQIPEKGSFSTASLLLALIGGDENLCNFQHKRLGKFDYNSKIGAAGELLVYEMLSSIKPGLPGLSKETWQSTMRKHVGCHPKYVNMAAWNGQETADFVYPDSAGILTDHLISKGYLDKERWSGKRPQFYIEVKATPGPCEKPFYMSAIQYNRMQQMSNVGSPEGRDDVIFIIFRVFQLSKANMGVKLYVDPEASRRKQELVFNGTLTVTPTPGF